MRSKYHIAAGYYVPGEKSCANPCPHIEVQAALPVLSHLFTRRLTRGAVSLEIVP